MNINKNIEKNRIKMMYLWFDNYCKNVQQSGNNNIVNIVSKGSFISPEYKFDSDIECGKKFKILPDHKYSDLIAPSKTHCGNFRLKCRKHLKFGDVIKKLELEIGGNLYETVYGESVCAKQKYMNITNACRYFKDGCVVYNIPLGSYTYHFPKYHQVKIFFETASGFTEEDIEIQYDKMDLANPEHYIFYATQYCSTETVKSMQKINTYFNHNVYGLFVKLSLDEYGPIVPLCSVVKNMFICLDDVEIKISNSLLKALETEYGYGMVPYCNPSLNCVEKLKRSINYSKIHKPSVKFEFYDLFESGVVKIFAFYFGGMHSNEMAMSHVWH